MPVLSEKQLVSGSRIKRDSARHAGRHVEEIVLERLPRGDDMIDGGDNSIPDSATYG